MSKQNGEIKRRSMAGDVAIRYFRKPTAVSAGSLAQRRMAATAASADSASRSATTASAPIRRLVNRWTKPPTPLAITAHPKRMNQMHPPAAKTIHAHNRTPRSASRHPSKRNGGGSFRAESPVVSASTTCSEGRTRIGTASLNTVRYDLDERSNHA